MVGEGANLGVTQRGRVAYAQKGGRIDTDAIDNSAGVDRCRTTRSTSRSCSASAIAAGALGAQEREPLLAQMKDDVAALVLRDNYLQGEALSVAEAADRRRSTARSLLIRELEKAGRLDRALEFLPDDEEIAARAAAHRGLTPAGARGAARLFEDVARRASCCNPICPTHQSSPRNCWPISRPLCASGSQRRSPLIRCAARSPPPSSPTISSTEPASPLSTRCKRAPAARRPRLPAPTASCARRSRCRRCGRRSRRSTTRLRPRCRAKCCSTSPGLSSMRLRGCCAPRGSAWRLRRHVSPRPSRARRKSR